MSTSGGGGSSPVSSSSSPTQATVALITFAAVAVAIQLTMVIAICVIWCRGGFRHMTTRGLTTSPRPVPVDVIEVRPRLTLLYRRLFRRGLPELPEANEAANGNTEGDNAGTEGGVSPPEAENNRVDVRNSALAEPPPPYDEALGMPRTSSGHVVYFYAGSDVGGGSESRVIFRFTMTDDLDASPPSFAEVMITDETIVAT